MDSELEALLRGEGRLDSSGTFTLDASKARIKLARFHLPPGLFICSLIQAGVAAGCERIHLDCRDPFLGRGLRVTYERPQARSFSLDAIMKGLAEPLSLPGGSPEAYLTEGILASQSAPAWLRVGKSGRDILRQNGEEVECWRSPKAGSEKAVLELSVLLPSSVVRERCQHSPVPVVVGTDPVVPRWGSPLQAVEFHVAAQYWGGQGGPVRLPPHRRPRVRDGQPESSAQPLEPGLFLEQIVGPPPWDSGLLIPTNLRGPATVHWVRHGVIICSEKLELGCPGLQAVVSAHGLTTDLSRYQLSHDEAYQARVQEVRTRVGHLLGKLGEHRESLSVPDYSFEAADRSVGALAVVSASLLLLTGLGVALPWCLLGACLAGPPAALLTFQVTRRSLERQATERVKSLLWPASH